MPWFKVDDKLHSHRKAYRAGHEALGLWVLCGSWCADQLTDGFVPDYVADRFARTSRELARTLVNAGLWEPAERDGEAGWVFNDWTDMNPARVDVEAKRQAAKDRMAAAREKKRLAREESDDEKRSREHDANFARSSRDVRSTPTRPDPTHISNASHYLSAIDADTRADVEAVCEHLAANLVANGCKPPTITKAWRNAARLMIDKDGHTEQQLHACIDWATNDSFWKANILSMPKLRQKYDQLRLAAERERANTGPGRRQQQTDQLFARAAQRITEPDPFQLTTGD